VLRRVLKQDEKISLGIFRWLSNLLMLLTATYLYFMVIEWLTSIYSSHESESVLLSSLLSGEYAWVFWLSIAALVIPFAITVWQFIRKEYSISLLVLSGVLVNLAAIGKRYLIVVPSQTHGSLMPYSTGFYSPTWVEIGVVLGLMGLGALLFMTFMKFFPILEIDEEMV